MLVLCVDCLSDVCQISCGDDHTFLPSGCVSVYMKHALPVKSAVSQPHLSVFFLVHRVL